MNELLRLVAATIPAAGRARLPAPAYAGFLAETSHPLRAGLARAAQTGDGALDPGTLLGNLAAMKGGALSRLEPSGDPRAPAPGRAAGAALLLPLHGRRAAVPREADEALARRGAAPGSPALEELAGGR